MENLEVIVLLLVLFMAFLIISIGVIVWTLNDLKDELKFINEKLYKIDK